MTFHDKDINYVKTTFNTDVNNGLNYTSLTESIKKYGKNKLTERKEQGFFSRVVTALKEPMLLILMFGFIIAFGINLGKYFKLGSADFEECFGILGAILLSVSITLIMEGSSKKAFEALNKIYDNVAVRVVRDGKIMLISQQDVAVGDVVYIESGDKIVADGRLIESSSLTVDESALTGESNSLFKRADVLLNSSVALAERKNCLYSGTFVTGGNGKMIVTAVGDATEIGNIAKELSVKNTDAIPLQQKLTKLGKTITIIGVLCAVFVFFVSILKLYFNGAVSFSAVQELFVSSIILIVAAVPEGLPTIVAVSLALNMIKLAGEKALIKKITATETAGCVSVICTDKTGTITENKMKVTSVCLNKYCDSNSKLISEVMAQNFICNSTADVSVRNNKKMFYGSGTECALVYKFMESNPNENYKDLRKRYSIVNREPFSGEKKYMTTTINISVAYRKLIKGAPERILDMCDLTLEQKNSLLKAMEKQQQKAKRVLCFAHYDYTSELGENYKYVYDGFVAIEDPIRKEVVKAVYECKNAGIKIKVLTGDNYVTALAIAKELGIATDDSNVINASQLEKMDDKTMSKVLEKVTVVARSTPAIKLRIVKVLKNKGEVVAVTGDGINDAPAIKHADVGIAMGVSGSEITKEAADIILLDDSFSTVVKTISFGRNVYRNLQRFITFQLSVNLSALLIITVSAIVGLPAPFNTFQLLWINVIMDGPPALTLGLESANGKLMSRKPVKREENIVSKTMLIKILFNGITVSTIVVIQYLTNFLGATIQEKGSVLFTLFIMFQLFNAFNCSQLGAESIFKNVWKNKIMLVTFLGVFVLHFVIVQFCAPVFGIMPMRFITWVKTVALASTIIVVSEMFKLVYLVINGKIKSGFRLKVYKRKKSCK